MPKRALGAVAAWLAFARKRSLAGEAIVDPLSDILAALGARRDVESTMVMFIDDPRLCPPLLGQDSEAIAAIARSLDGLLLDPENLPD